MITAKNMLLRNMAITLSDYINDAKESDNGVLAYMGFRNIDFSKAQIVIFETLLTFIKSQITSTCSNTKEEIALFKGVEKKCESNFAI